MGKGDKKSRKGKIAMGSHGVLRPTKKAIAKVKEAKMKNPAAPVKAAVVSEKAEAPAKKAVTAEKTAAPAKKAAPKKAAAKKAE